MVPLRPRTTPRVPVSMRTYFAADRQILSLHPWRRIRPSKNRRDGASAHRFDAQRSWHCAFVHSAVGTMHLRSKPLELSENHASFSEAGSSLSAFLVYRVLRYSPHPAVQKLQLL